ncbi:MAG TPA: SH3 domain-containing protein [bacterium]|nr:SH3 domain-containing protein [bacterium]
MVRRLRFFLALLTLAFVLASLPATTARADGGEAQVRADELNVRRGPGTEYAVIFTLNKGDVVTIVGSQAGWYQVQTDDGRRGWVASRHLNRVNWPQAATQTPSSKKQETQSATKMSTTKKSSSKKKAKKDRVRGVPRPGPKYAVTPKVGLAAPFFDVLTPALEIDLWGRVVRDNKNDVYLTASLGYAYLYANRAFGGDPDLEGHWLPLYVGAIGTLKLWPEATPYGGGGLGLNYYDFTIHEDETNLDIDDDDVRGIGLGARGVAGVWIHLKSGTIVLEEQLHLTKIENGITPSNVLFVGYRFSW